MDHQKQSEPNYFAIIPAPVRYDKRLRPLARLLYGEITALAKREGYCWAGNQYFADLYEVEKNTVSGWISELAACGYINVEMEYGNQTIRKIRIGNPDIQEGCTSKNGGVSHGKTSKSESLLYKKTSSTTKRTKKNTEEEEKAPAKAGATPKPDRDILDSQWEAFILEWNNLTGENQPVDSPLKKYFYGKVSKFGAQTVFQAMQNYANHDWHKKNKQWSLSKMFTDPSFVGKWSVMKNKMTSDDQWQAYLDKKEAKNGDDSGESNDFFAKLFSGGK